MVRSEGNLVWLQRRQQERTKQSAKTKIHKKLEKQLQTNNFQRKISLRTSKIQYQLQLNWINVRKMHDSNQKELN